MKIVNDAASLVNVLNDCVVTIGNFDGVHLGHQDLLAQIKEKTSSDIVIVTFDPHPKFILDGKLKKYLIYSYQKRYELLASLGVKAIILYSFDKSYLQLSGEEFLGEIFKQNYAKSFFAGHDFSLGANKKFNSNKMKEYCQKKKINFIQGEPFQYKNIQVSSSEIRKNLEQGNIILTNEMLGRAYSIIGKVVKGKGLGRQIGFPTANLKLPSSLLEIKKGVYLVYSFIKKQRYIGLLNVGLNPTTDTDLSTKYEVYFISMDIDIYGEELEVFFVDFIRPEKKFDNIEALRKQIEIDVEKAKKYLC